MSVYKKIALVMQDVHYLQKDDQVQFGNTKYKAISEEKVTMSVRDSMVKHGLVIIPVEQEHHREPIGDKGNYLSTVNVKYKIVDIDTGDSIEAVSSGTGVDTQDKGVGKAMTYAYKYLLLRTFAIPTGDDPDKVSSAEWDAKENTKPATQKNDKRATAKQIGEIKLLAEQLVPLGVSKKDSFNLMQLEVGNFSKLEELSEDRATRAIKQLENLKAQHSQEKAAV